MLATGWRGATRPGSARRSCRPDALRAGPPASWASRASGRSHRGSGNRRDGPPCRGPPRRRAWRQRRPAPSGGGGGSSRSLGAAPPSGSRPPDPACETSCDRRSTDRQVPGAAPSDWFPIMLTAVVTSATTALAAVAHSLPAVCPLAPPAKGALADGADLLGQMGFAMHGTSDGWQ